MYRVMLVEDDARLAELVTEYLRILVIRRLQQRKHGAPGSVERQVQLGRLARQRQLQSVDAGAVLRDDDAPAAIEGEARLLARAIGNLLRNAQKYAAGRIVLSARHCSVDQVEIAVEDDGPGIPAEKRERVFEPFYRLDRSRDRATGGFGLGLSIAHKAVALHGGTLRVEDSALRGARLVLTLPVSADLVQARAA